MGLFDIFKSKPEGAGATVSDNDASVLNRRQVLAGIAGVTAAAVLPGTQGEAAEGENWRKNLRDDVTVKNLTDSVKNPRVVGHGKSNILYDGADMFLVDTDCGKQAVTVTHGKDGMNRIITVFGLTELAGLDRETKKADYSIKGRNNLTIDADMDGSGQSMYYEYNAAQLGKKWVEPGKPVVHPDSDILRVVFQNSTRCQVTGSSSKPGEPTPPTPPPPPPPEPEPEFPGGGCQQGPAC